MKFTIWFHVLFIFLYVYELLKNKITSLLVMWFIVSNFNKDASLLTQMNHGDYSVKCATLNGI